MPRVASSTPSADPISIGHDIRTHLLIQFSNSPGTRSHSRGAIRARAVQNMSLEKDRGRREDRVPATAPTAPAQKRLRERALTTGTGGNHAGLPCAVALRLIRDLVSAKSARMCERAVLTNRPSLDLSPYVLKGRKSLTGS